ncbi:MAG: DUF1206 domain-containing protein [Marmoricola sp.]
MLQQTEELRRKAADSDVLDAAIRLGLVAYGVVHLLIAWIAVQLAFGHDQGQASAQGAMKELAGKPLGGVLVWAVAVGMFALVVWRLLEAAVGHRDAEDSKRPWLRLLSHPKAVVYGAIGVSGAKVALGSGGSGQGKGMTAKVMDWPAGTWIIGAVGLVIIGVGVAHVRKGLSEDYRDGLSSEGKRGETGDAYLLFGKVGYVAKGVAICSVGLLFGYAAISHDPNRSGGLDTALRTVLEQPYGPYLLCALALGLGCFGLFCLARARHLST